MPPKNTKVQQIGTSSKKPAKVDKHVLLRDLTTDTLLIVSYDNISTSKASKIGVGTEVTYVVSSRIRHRGTILFIGTEEECTELLMVLEKGSSSRNSNENQSPLVMDDLDEKSESEIEEEEIEPSRNEEQENIIVAPRVSSNTNIEKKNLSAKSPPKNNKRPLPLGNKSLNQEDDNTSTSKRLKNNDDDTSTYLRGRIVELQEENKKLRDRMEEMETSWMPRPDPITIEYFSRIVSLCSGGDRDDGQSKGDKLADIMNILNMSEAELNKCTDLNSIRSTCRRLVRVKFQADLANPKTHFGDVLKKKEYQDMISAIHAYGRLMHPIESVKFTLGELNNAMGSDFYQRDRNLKMHHTETFDNSGGDDAIDDGDSDE